MMGRALLAAILAGVAAGLLLTVVQMWRVTPLILEAETYETGAAPDHAGWTLPGGGRLILAHAGHDEEGHEAWAPADGIERTAYTALANILTGTAYSLILLAGMMASGRPVTAATGLVWGGLGFLVFQLAPAAGLAPELPGMPAADLFARQVWWWATVAATAGGIACIALARPVAVKALGAVLIALPHIVGAPHPESHASDVPAGLAASFAANSLAASALFWIVLGGLLGWAVARQMSETTKTAEA